VCGGSSGGGCVCPTGTTNCFGGPDLITDCCAPGQDCINGICFTPPSSVCNPPTAPCQTGCCQGGVCVGSCATNLCCIGGSCTTCPVACSATSCPHNPGNMCCDPSSGTCVTKCPVGECCSGGTCQLCPNCVATPCVTFCTSGCVCHGGTCCKGCSLDVDCPQGQTCNQTTFCCV
jgi:hypothetical protein